MFKRLLIGLLITALGLSAAAAQDGPRLFVPGLGTVRGQMLTIETFDAPDSWEHYSNPSGVELGVFNGVYRAFTFNPGYVWGLNETDHTDVILQVEATPLTPNFENGFGLMCRASSSGDGYYFMMNPNGYFSILKGQGDALVTLVDWQPARAIRPQIDRNVMQAVCIGSHLALYINQQLVGEVEDGTYQHGYAGLSVASAGSDVDVAFDNLIIYEANSGISA